MEEFAKLVENYLKKHPKAQSPFDYVEGLGIQLITDILNKSKGREVVFKEGAGFDKVTFSYKPSK